MKSSAYFSPSGRPLGDQTSTSPCRGGWINREPVEFRCCKNRTLDMAKEERLKHKREMLSPPWRLLFLMSSTLHASSLDHRWCSDEKAKLPFS